MKEESYKNDTQEIELKNDFTDKTMNKNEISGSKPKKITPPKASSYNTPVNKCVNSQERFDDDFIVGSYNPKKNCSYNLKSHKPKVETVAKICFNSSEQPSTNITVSGNTTETKIFEGDDFIFGRFEV